MTAPNYQTFDLFNPTVEHEMLRKSVKDFALKEVEPGALQRDAQESFDSALFRKIGALGLLGITVDEKYGGSAMDATAVVIAHEELSYSDPGFCLAYLAHALLCANNLNTNGNEAQKQKYLPKLCSGEFIGAMAMSEPDFGTDVLGMQTTAKRDGDDYLINGRKMWITNGAISEELDPCDCVYVYAKTGEKEGKPLLSTFMIDRSHPGFSVGQKIGGKTGMRASTTTELVFENCRVPKSALVGTEGGSVKSMMRNLEIERLGLAAMSLGIAMRCLDIMVSYAKERHAFKKPLWHFGQIQRHIADSYAEFQAARAYVYNTARNIKLQGQGQRLDSDGVKLVCAPMAKNIADRAIQVLGGNGYVSEYVVERLWRDAKLLEIGGGTLEAHQKNLTYDLCRG